MRGKEPAEPRRYANWLEVGFNSDEFVLDFGQKFDESDPEIHTGIVTTPAGARDFLKTLEESAEQHQRQHGDPGAERKP